jgi:hypothetical protein
MVQPVTHGDTRQARVGIDSPRHATSSVRDAGVRPGAHRAPSRPPIPACIQSICAAILLTTTTADVRCRNLL